MAEVLGVVASAIQVADLGFRLSKNIYSYAEAATTADVRITHLGRDVKLTSVAIKELGRVFEDAKVQALLRDEASDAAFEAMDACKSIFQSIGSALEKSKSSKLKLNWPFRQVKIELLNADLDRLKSTLMLLMEVLQYARSTKQKEIDKERLDKIENLIREKNEAVARYEAILLANQGGGQVSYDNSIATRNLSMPNGSPGGPTATHDASMENPGHVAVQFDLREHQGSARSSSGTPGLTTEALDQVESHIKYLLELVGNVKRSVSRPAINSTTPRHQQAMLQRTWLNTRSEINNILHPDERTDQFTSPFKSMWKTLEIGTTSAIVQSSSLLKSMGRNLRIGILSAVDYFLSWFVTIDDDYGTLPEDSTTIDMAPPPLPYGSEVTPLIGHNGLSRVSASIDFPEDSSSSFIGRFRSSIREKVRSNMRKDGMAGSPPESVPEPAVSRANGHSGGGPESIHGHDALEMLRLWTKALD
ncbi:hypothetical protein HDK77DRAFT_486868 [Phyllosticta capitalensis]